MRFFSQSLSSRTPASVTAISGPAAQAIAALRPRLMFAPGSTNTLTSPRQPPCASAHSRIRRTVSSVLPPSQITTSSGSRVCSASDASSLPILFCSLYTVATTDTCMAPLCPTALPNTKLRPRLRTCRFARLPLLSPSSTLARSGTGPPVPPLMGLLFPPKPIRIIGREIV